MSIVVPTPAPPAPRGLFIACKDCMRDFRSSELGDLMCIGCRVHRRCAEVCAEIDAYIKKQRRYASVGAIADQKQFIRLRRRLIRRVQELAPDPRVGMELAEKEYQAVLNPHGLVSRGGVLEVVQASQLLR